MRRSRTRSSLVILLALVCILLAWMIYQEIAENPPVQATALSGDLAALGAPSPAASEASFSMPGRESLAVILERPLFTQTRRPSSVAGGDPLAGSVDLTLSGVVISGGERSALIRRGNAEIVERLKQGEDIAGWTLVEIAADRVIVRRDAIETEILLDYSAPAPPGPRTEQRKQDPEPAAAAKQDEQQMNGAAEPEAETDDAPAN
jgi:Type II secretion system protein C